jgi:hypothetical protein
MKRRRHVLQVSTFPFLAVLLCAMGSLILLLLVIDRRARVVALAKARQAAAAASLEKQHDAAQHAAELERRRQALHAALQAEEDEVVAAVHGIERNVSQAASATKAEQSKLQQLASRLNDERAQLAQTGEALARAKTEASRAVQNSEMSRAEILRLAADLTKLEQTLDDLRKLRKQQQETYSLVPFTGKRGESRRPLYIECNAAGIIFHPDRESLEASNCKPADIRAAVQRRLARQQAEVIPANHQSDKGPYVLLLVRPDGITHYYRTLAALQPLDIDFGYEFLERDWVLDFSEEKSGPSDQPWLAARPPTPASANQPATATKTVRGVRNGALGEGEAKKDPPRDAGNGSVLSPTSVAGGASSGGGSGTTVEAASPAGGSGLPGETPRARPGVGGLGQSPISGAATGSGFAGGSRPDVPSGPSVPDGSSPFAAGAPVGLTVPQGAGPTGTGATSIGPPTAAPPGLFAAAGLTTPQGTGSFGAGTPSIGPPTAAPPGLFATPGPTVPQGTGPSGTGAPSLGVPTAAPPGLFAAGAPSPATTGFASPPPASQGGIPPNPNDGVPNSAHGTASSGPPGSNPAAAGTVRPHGVRGDAGGGVEDSPSTGGDDLPGVSPSPFASSSSENKPAKRAQSLPARLVGNRDWLITVECKADGVEVLPAHERLPLAAFSLGGPNNMLVKLIREMIDRKQGTVRPGEPPFRPQLRFLVPADGLRTYYTAYPLLEPLGVPMTRENVLEDPRPMRG